VPDPLAPLFPSRQRRSGRSVGLGAKMVHLIVKRYGSKVKRPIGYVRGHALRHSIATAILEAGGSIEDVADHLGQRSVKSAEVYAQITDPRRKALAARLATSRAVART
jgi:integrase